VRLASFNVENLFARPRVFHRGDWSEGEAVLTAYGGVASLLEEPTYTTAIKKNLVAGLEDLGLAKSDATKFVVLRQNRGRLVKRTAAGPQIAAKGRADWVGWLELKMRLASEVCVQNTARVVSELNPDVIAVIEADNRPALKQFSADFVPAAPGPGQEFKYVMLIDGNDDRGIDVGIMSRGPFPIADMASHVDDADDDGVVFSRDCAEFVIRTPAQHNVLVMVNHLKSKGYGGQAASDARRRRQAQRVADIYLRRRKQYPYIAVAGDFNDTPTSAPLAPLFDATDLRNISDHPDYIDDGIPGTWGKGYASNHIDFILLSPALFNKVRSGGAFRAGVWDDRKTPKWQVFDTITKAEDAASDHAAVWADVNV
jgi:endonuclease/exonuclease/phosphatase family metal-dependent hydrolase